MIGALIAAAFTLSLMCDATEKAYYADYMAKLDREKVGKTIVRTPKESFTIFTFSSVQDAV